MSNHISQLVRHTVVMRRLEVRRCERLSPNLQRVVLGGEALRGFISAAPDDHVKVFFPNPEGVLVLPSMGPNGLEHPAGVTPSPMRDYTPYHFDPEALELTLDFVLHGTGPATSWAAQAAPGQWLGTGGPRGSFVVADDFDTYVMIGDETALPAIGRWLRELPATARAEVLLEIPVAADRQSFTSAASVNVRWLERDGADAATSQRLEQALRELPSPAGDTFWWIACESRRARAMRIYLAGERQVPKDWLKATGYWKAGADEEE